MRSRKLFVLAAVVAAATGVLAATAGVAAPKQHTAAKSVTLVWWHNANQGAGLALWQAVAKEFHAKHPNVTVKPVAFQNEVLQNTRIPIALQSNNPPDVFQNWGGGSLVDQVKAGKVQDLTKYVKPWIASLGGSVAGWQVN